MKELYRWRLAGRPVATLGLGRLLDIIPRSALGLLLVCSLSLLLLRPTPAGVILDETWGSGWQSRWSVSGTTVVYTGYIDADHAARVYTNCGVATEYTVSVRSDSSGTYGYQLHVHGSTSDEDNGWDFTVNRPGGWYFLAEGSDEIGCDTGMVIGTGGGWVSVGTLTSSVTAAGDGYVTGGTVAISVTGGSIPGSLPRVVIEGGDNTPPTTPTNLQAGTPERHRASLSWNRSTDSESGMQYYQVYRSGVAVASVDATTTLCGNEPAPRCAYMDDGLADGSNFTYTVTAVDREWNESPPSNAVLVTTLRAPQQRPEGLGSGPLAAYYGSGAEQINLESGDLTLRIPLLPIQGRSSATSPTLSLVYNSQLWTWDGAGARLALVDAGYGPGCSLWLGAIYPVHVDYQLNHFRYIDSSGATHRLYPTTGDLYMSRDSTYMLWDRVLNRLTFRDGTYWDFDYVASDGGPDSGTRYPTRIQDTNGNYVTIEYTTGARVSAIKDSRGTHPTIPNQWYGYMFEYTTPGNRLLRINERYPAPGGGWPWVSTRVSFEYSADTTLVSPFGGSETVSGQKLLTKVRRVAAWPASDYEIQYNASGEATKLTLLYGGYFRYEYDTFSFANNAIKRREVVRRSWSALTRDDAHYGQAAYEQTDEFVRATGDASHSGHNQTTLNDAAHNRKVWYFTQGDPLGWKNGLQWKQEVYQGAGVTLLRTFLTSWTQRNPAASELQNPRPSVLRTQLNDASPLLESRREQDVAYEQDQYYDPVKDAGNVTQVREFGYTDAGNPVRTLTVSYLATTPYTSRGILNRPLASALRQGGAGGQVLTSGSVQYDASALTNITPAPPMHDTSYGTSFTVRGNATHVTPLGGRQTVSYNDILGKVRLVTDAGGYTLKTVSYDSTLGYTVPTGINSNTAIGVDAVYYGDLTLASQTAASGEEVSYAWDNAKRPTEVTSPSGQTTTYLYNDTFNPPTVVATVSVNTGAGNDLETGSYTITRTMDGFGRVVLVQDSRTNAYVKSEYDSCSCSPNGREMKVSNPYLSGETPLWTVSEYDALGRVTRVMLPDDDPNHVPPIGPSTTTTSYFSNTSTVTDPAGKRKKFTHDAFGKLTQVAEPDAQGNLTVLTNYEYDAASRLTDVKMNGTAQQRHFEYNVYNQVTSVTNPENGTVSYTYRAADGLLTSKLDAKSQVVNFDYDGLRRVTRIYPPQGANYGYETRLYYDTYPPAPGENIYGRLAAIEWSQPGLQIGQYWHSYNYVHRFSYDAASGAVTDSTVIQKDTYNGQTTPRSLDVGFTWTVQGTPATVTNNSLGRSLAYHFDTAGRLNGLQQLQAGGFPAVDLVTAASYNKAGQLLTMDFLDAVAVRETRTYDPVLQQLTRIQVAATAPPYSGQFDLEYQYPAAGSNNGRITAEVDHLASNTTVSYTYDAYNRLATANSVTGGTTNWGLSFSYDVYGNRTAQTVTAGTAPAFSAAFDNANHMVGYSYDQNGNQLTTADGATLGYDWDNRMTNWSSSGASEAYHYHPSGWRVWKKPSTGAGTLYLHGPSGNLLCEQADDWSGPPADYIYFGGRLLYTVRKESGTWTRTALLTDRRGSVRNGGKSYYPFGEEIGTSANNAFKFAQTYRDSNSGLDYAHHRYYSSGMARFLSADPARARRHSPGSWNRHRYAGNDPVNRIDPLGLDDYTDEDDLLCSVKGICEPEGEVPEDIGLVIKVLVTAPPPEPVDTVPPGLPPPPGDEPGDEPGGGGGGGDGGDGGGCDGGGGGGGGGGGIRRGPGTTACITATNTMNAICASYGAALLFCVTTRNPAVCLSILPLGVSCAVAIANQRYQCREWPWS